MQSVHSRSTGGPEPFLTQIVARKGTILFHGLCCSQACKGNRLGCRVYTAGPEPFLTQIVARKGTILFIRRSQNITRWSAARAGILPKPPAGPGWPAGPSTCAARRGPAWRPECAARREEAGGEPAGAAGSRPGRQDGAARAAGRGLFRSLAPSPHRSLVCGGRRGEGLSRSHLGLWRGADSLACRRQAAGLPPRPARANAPLLR